MLSVMATAKTTVGAGRRNPWDIPRAVAQTASRTAEAIRTIHAMSMFPFHVFVRLCQKDSST